MFTYVRHDARQHATRLVYSGAEPPIGADSLKEVHMRRIVHPSRAQRTSRNTSPPTRHPRRGAALHIAAAIVALGAVAYMGVTSVMPTSSTVSASKKLKYLTPPTAIEVDASLGELGLTPKVLAAAGLSAEQTASFAGAAATYMRDHIADYRVAQDSVGQYRNESASLERLVRGGPPSQELLASLSTARSNLASAIAARQAVLDAAMADAGAQISAPALALLNTARAHHRAWDVRE